MALPTSTIVMALLTAVPFGMAVRDQVTGKGGYEATEELDGFDESYERNARLEREHEERQENERREEKVKLETELRRLYSPSLATSSLALIGSPEELVQLDTIHSIERSTKSRISVDSKNGTVRTVSVTLRHPDDYEKANPCSMLGEQLAEIWGEHESTYQDDGTRSHWVDKAKRASLFDNDTTCTLLFEQTTQIPDMFNQTQTSVVPLWAVNQPAAKLVAKLGADAFSNKTEIRWTAPGVGNGIGDTDMFASINNGRIVTLVATFSATTKTLDLIASNLTVMFGDPEENYSYSKSWPKAKTTIEQSDDDSNRYVMVIGKPLPETPADE